MEKECPHCEDPLTEQEGVSNYPGKDGEPCETSESFLECEKCGRQFVYEEDEDGPTLHEI